VIIIRTVYNIIKKSLKTADTRTSAANKSNNITRIICIIPNLVYVLYMNDM